MTTGPMPFEQMPIKSKGAQISGPRPKGLSDTSTLSGLDTGRRQLRRDAQAFPTSKRLRAQISRAEHSVGQPYMCNSPEDSPGERSKPCMQHGPRVMGEHCPAWR